MDVLRRIKQIFIPIDQPTDFPRLYFIPETREVDGPRRSANDTYYRPPVILQPIRKTVPAPKVERQNFIQLFIQRQKENFYLACEEAWSATIFFGRTVVRWLVWRVILPLSVMACLWIPSIHPMDLPI